MKDITTEEAIKDLKSLIEEYKDCSVEGLNMQVDVGFNEERCKNLEKVLNELDTLQNGFNTAVEHQTELIRENSHLRYELFNNKKELEEEKEKIKAMNKGIDELVREKQDLKTQLYMNSVSKDKIKTKIEELEGQEDWYIENKSLDDLYGRIDELKELLKEE